MKYRGIFCHYLLRIPYIIMGFCCGIAELNSQISESTPQKLKPFPANIASALQATLNLQGINIGYPGISSAITIPGYETWKGTYGFSEPSRGISICDDMIFGMGSITKSFTSAIIIQLAEDGLLDLNEPISKYLPPYNNINSSVTIKQLLGMTSGVFDFDSSSKGAWDDAIREPFKIWNPEDVLSEYIEPMLFSPGTRWEYSNTNYILAGLIIEEITGRSYSEEVRSRILDHYALSSTSVGGFEPTPQNIAYTDYNRDGAINALNDRALPSLTSMAWAAGGLLSTPEDLNKWSRALFGGDVLSAGFLTEMLDFGGDRRASNYGLGVGTWILDGRRLIGHDGWLSYASSMLYFSESGIAYSFMANDESIWSTEGWSQLNTSMLKTLMRYQFDQSIAFDLFEYRFLSDGDFLLEASTPVTFAGIPIHFEVMDGPAELVDGRIHLTGEGKVTVKATQSETSFFRETVAHRSFYAYAKDGDADGDGVSNFVESLFAMNLETPDRDDLPQIEINNGRISLSFRIGRNDHFYIVETSTNLIEWTEGGVTIKEGDYSKMSATVSISENESRFLRLRVEK